VLINIIDPALADRFGHHFDWTLKIIKRLNILGYKVTIFGNKNISANVKAELELYGKVISLFSGNPYSRPNKENPLCTDIQFYFERSLSLASELKQINQNCTWIWPTLFDFQLNALALAKINCHVTAIIHTAPGYRYPAAPAMWRNAAVQARKENIDIRLGATFKELVPLFFPLVEQALFVTPILVDANPPLAPKSTMKRVGFFGHQSIRKGSKLISDLTQHLLKAGLEVVVQNSTGKVNGKQSQQLSILGYIEDFSEEISKCDLVILPYDSDVYKNMASGVAWEAIARAVPVIAPANTVPGGFVTSENAGITFKEFSAHSIIDAVTQASSEFKSIADGAFRASKNWSTNNGTDKFVEAILSSRN
jgi:hypothetical protein